MNYFEELCKIDCSAHVEKKGQFTYLSWPFAVSELLKRHPDATWTVYDFDGSPYTKTDAGCFVKVGVTVGGIERIQWHPVLNSSNNTIKEPDAFQVNTSIQRALVKAIALHGLGLYIYAGEDIPSGTADPRESEPAKKPKLDHGKYLSSFGITDPKHPVFKALKKAHADNWRQVIEDYRDIMEEFDGEPTPEHFRAHIGTWKK